MTDEDKTTNLNLFDPEVQACPWTAYKAMRDRGAVYHDAVSGFFIVTRYDELRQVLLDDETFLVKNPSGTGRIWSSAPWGPKVEREFEQKGWVYGDSLQGMNGTLHREVRGVFDQAFRASRIRELDAVAADIAHGLVDAFVEDGACDWVKQFAVPLPLYVIGRQAGVDDADLPRILEWTDAFIGLFGMMNSEDEAMENVGKLIEAQHFFQPMIDRLRAHPDDSLLSDLVNLEVPVLGRKLNDNELHTHIMLELFVGGAETTRNALSAGMLVLIEEDGVWDKLQGETDRYMKTFVEEVLRTHSPAQGLYKFAQKDTELYGVDIPKGATVIPRYGSANRDERHFENPDKFDLERKNAGSHLAFGSGPHHCLGASLARREMVWGFRAAVERFEKVWFAEGKNDFAYHANFALRGLKELHIEFTPKA